MRGSPDAVLSAALAADEGRTWLARALRLPPGQEPFPWQLRLLEEFRRGRIPGALDIPTGLGKTAVMAVWLVARALGAGVPRRLVYVVDRRAVVDQATRVAEGLRDFVERSPDFKRALGFDGRTLPVSTLRGQFVDNKEWLDDPAAAAVIVGTVDMVGSRLLFEGYGVGRKMRPFHAGLLGQDTLLVLDEAHLISPFLKLVEAITNGASEFGPRTQFFDVLPPLRMIAMSATGARPQSGHSFELDGADIKHPEIARRLNASKTLFVKEVSTSEALAEALASEAWFLAEKASTSRIIVYCDQRRIAEAVVDDLRGRVKARKGTADDVGLLVGARRVLERQGVDQWLLDHGFVNGDDGEWAARERPAFLVATAAGEVGVDLDADHLVADVVPWERLVQRLGRVNRFGKGNARVVLLTHDSSFKEGSEDGSLDGERMKAVLSVLERLPRHPTDARGRDASNASIGRLKTEATRNPDVGRLMDMATTPNPMRPRLTRALVDAWSATSLANHTGRPEIQPWLRGWTTEDSQTRVIWRKLLPFARTDGDPLVASRRRISEFFEAAPPSLQEVLEAETWYIVEWLGKRAKALRPGEKETYGFLEGEAIGPFDDDVVACVLSPANEFVTSLRLPDLLSVERLKRLKEAELANMTLVVDARFAGLSEDGLLDHRAGNPPRTVDDGLPFGHGEENRFRIREVSVGSDGVENGNWVEEIRVPIETNDEGITIRWLLVESLPRELVAEDARGAGAKRLQLLDEHGEWAGKRAAQIAQRLGLSAEYANVLVLAARHHDDGKAAERWQRAFGAPDDGKKYAKTMARRIDFAVLDGYRHELGSLVEFSRGPRVRELSPELQDLACHLIVSHHGFARPTIPTRSVEGMPPSQLEETSREVALRYTRLQKQWGPWGLAWWEGLLRAADHQASADNDEWRAGG